EGIERIVDIKLTKDELDMFNSSVESVKSLVSACKAIDNSLN
ncbi:MAG: malate dehydrogenase, partial [Pseudomonadota bacterium]|nr:malate dehydrogenase [Pseudomonadota bacterium]